MSTINSFRGEYAFLSNYFTAPFVWRGIQFQSAEQAFAYAKTFFANEHDANKYRGMIMASASPGLAKAHGRAVRIDVSEWDKHKVMYMREIVHAKFATGQSDIDLVGSLINTAPRMLVEGNDWGDTTWGRCKVNGKWVGENLLGVLLMEERGYWLHTDFKEK